MAYRVPLALAHASALLGLLACDSAEPDPSAIRKIEASGTATFMDGTPVPSQTAQFQLVLDGTNLFASEVGKNDCTETPAHVAGTVITSQPLQSGAYSLSLNTDSLYAAVVRACRLNTLALSQIGGILLKASIPATPENCTLYCAAEPNPAANCVADCSAGKRTIGATVKLQKEELAKTVRKEENGTRLAWPAPLVFTGLGPALTPGSAPDLQPDATSLPASIQITQERFSNGACEIADQCVRGPGLRRVLRFDGTINNIGDSDLVLGSPEDNPLFEISACHRVPLLRNIMLYELIEPVTGLVVRVGDQDVIGRKQGFCMMDIAQLNGSAPMGIYDCGYQGITAGWADVYDSSLDCQFLDITDVPAGEYQLRLTVNPDGLLQESNTSNNSTTVPVRIPSL